MPMRTSVRSKSMGRCVSGDGAVAKSPHFEKGSDMHKGKWMMAVAAAMVLTAAAQSATPPELSAAIANPARGAEARARDAWRHPAETLDFFGFRPDMTVIEIAPGGGWYTDILAPALKDRGHYVATVPAGTSENAAKARTAFESRLNARPETYGKVTFAEFGKGATKDFVPAGSADMVLTFRNVHNWLSAGFAQDAFDAFYAALKPGGVLGVVEHRMPENRTDDGTTGYVKQSAVIRMAEAAGFRLAGKSEVNANPRDTADHPKGVWTLPPTYMLGDTDRAKYQAIGESDRMTLKFVKPAKPR